MDATLSGVVRTEKLKIGIIAGAFDVIHPGYILAFMEAKAHCSILVVCLHIDPSLENGKPKPVLTWQERKVILKAIRYVDYVLPYATELDFLNILKNVNPDVRFLGQDYSIGIKKITGSELNIPIVYLDRSHEWSATKFKKLICESARDIDYGSKEHFTLTEEEWHGITNPDVRCWRCAKFHCLNKDNLCEDCFRKEKKFQ